MAEVTLEEVFQPLDDLDGPALPLGTSESGAG